MSKHERIYICHTFYHVYVACLKELHLRHLAADSMEVAPAALVLSKMSNRFGSMVDRARNCPLFDEVYEYDEQTETGYPELMALKQDRGSLPLNMLQRIRFCRKLGALQESFLPVDLRQYGEVYVFCDSDPIGYYLNWKKIPYHALEDGLDAIKYYDTARYDNRGHFNIKAWMAARGLIHIQNGWSRYCLDMEVNNMQILEYPCPKYIEQSREELVQELTEQDRDILLTLFLENKAQLMATLQSQGDAPRVLILSEPLCDMDTRKQIFSDLIRTYSKLDGQACVVMIKQHPRDLLDYRKEFPETILLDGTFPMEMLNFIPNLEFDRVVSVYTVVDTLNFVKEKIFLGDDFMDLYEDPKLHRFNEQITD